MNFYSILVPNDIKDAENGEMRKIGTIYSNYDDAQIVRSALLEKYKLVVITKGL